MLDGLRAVAILAVMGMHFTVVDPPILRQSTSLDHTIWQMGLSGWIGVDLFFVLSGFLITGILLETKGGVGYFRNFYVRRVLRILPLYYSGLVLLFLVIPRVTPSIVHDLGRLTNGQVWLWTYTSNIAVGIKGAWDATPPLTGHYWSLAVEEQFYLVWPLVVYLSTQRSLLRIASWLCVTALVLRIALLQAGVSPTSVFVLTPTRMDGLASGAVVAILARRPGGLTPVRSFAKYVIVAGILGLAVIVAVTGTIGQYNVLTQTVGFTLLSATFAALLTLVVSGPAHTRVGRILSHSWVRHVGMRSYALYVFHPWILKAAWRVGRVNVIPLLGGSAIARQIVFWVACLSVSLLVAEISWHILEKRCLALKRFFPRATGVAPSMPASEPVTP